MEPITNATPLNELPLDESGVKIRVARAMRDVGSVAKSQTANTGKYTYNYARLEDVLKAVQEPLAEQDLVLSQPIVVIDGMLVIHNVITCLRTGIQINMGGPGSQVKNDPQAAGSTITYYRRYSLLSLFGIKQDDDDGGVASRQANTPENRTPAETEIRKIVGSLSSADRGAFQSDFLEAMGSTLSRLPESAHGDALTWAKEWQTKHEAAS